MGEIRKLSSREIEKLCAGEVVEGPASVVKELVENSIDAGASEIEVELEAGGKGLIRVADDGTGIAREDLEKTVERHATSKIDEVDDLFSGFSQLGFRGEALASIAAVSHLTITSVHEDADSGAKLEVRGGEIYDKSPAAIRAGTVVEVRDLFYNTPARRKFLRTKRTELHHITRRMISYALARPDIAFTLVSDGREKLNTAGDGDLRAILAELFDRETAEAMLELDYSSGDYSVSGFVAPPSIHRKNRGGQVFFVNGRPVRHKLLFKGVDEGTIEFLSPDKRAVAVVFLDLPADELDVNVHPQKEEVSFSESGMVVSSIKEAVKRALARGATERRSELREKMTDLPPPEVKTEEPDQEEIDRSSEERGIPVYNQGDKLAGGEPADQAGGSDRSHLEIADDTASGEETRSGEEVPDAETGNGEPPPGGWSQPDTERLRLYQSFQDEERELLGQVELTYVALVRGGELFLVDQHSAHERILFDRLWNTRKQGGEERLKRQELMFPLAVELREDQVELVREYRDYLERLSFTFETPAPDRVELTRLPAFLADRVDESVVREIVEDLTQLEGIDREQRLVKELSATAACRAAVKSGDRLNEGQMKGLVEDLLAIADSTACPHGRPTIVRVPEGEMEKLFLRDRG